MNAYVIVATKGRAPDVYELLSWLKKQTVEPTHVYVAGASQDDVKGLNQHPFCQNGRVTIMVTQAAGSCLQRNAAIKDARARGWLASDDSCGVFFDDDYRPDVRWIERAVGHFKQHPEVVGLTGHVLADGAHGSPLTSADAQAYISGARPPEKHWASGADIRHTEAVYGCNMAFRANALREILFDEALPLYGWQEDQDFTTQAARMGSVIYLPTCKGVHLGAKSGRTSGVRFGYSQIANPLYLIRKGTMPKPKAYRFILRHLAANTIKSLGNYPLVDYPGRLRGNFRALLDILARRCDPRRVVDLS
jgi:GT2 family glycosyltransferase